MKHDLREIARHMISRKSWRWYPGMLDTDGRRWGDVTLHDSSRWSVGSETDFRLFGKPGPETIPDLSDSTTKRAIEEILERHGLGIERRYTDGSYGLWTWDYSVIRHDGGPPVEISDHDNLLSALLAGLDAAS